MRSFSIDDFEQIIRYCTSQVNWIIFLVFHLFYQSFFYLFLLFFRLESYLKYPNPTIPLPSLINFSFSSKDGGVFLKVISSSSSSSSSLASISFLFYFLYLDLVKTVAEILGVFLGAPFFFIEGFSSSSSSSSASFTS